MALLIAQADADLIDVKTVINFNKFKPRQIKNFCNFLRKRTFAQSYRGVAGMAKHVIREHDNVNMYFTKGRDPSCRVYGDEDPKEMEKLLEAFKTDFALFLLSDKFSKESAEDQWMNKRVREIQTELEQGENPFKYRNAWFMRGHFYNVNKFEPDPLPADHPLMEFADKVERGEITHYEINMLR